VLHRVYQGGEDVVPVQRRCLVPVERSLRVVAVAGLRPDNDG